jgi:tetratricopeptide (TPR) repeat protein
LAQLYYQQTQFDKVYTIATSKPMKTHVETQFLKAKAYIQQQRYVDAIHWLKEINKNVKGNYNVLLALAKILTQVPDTKLREPQQALEFARQAVALQSNAQSYWQLIIALDEAQQCDALKENVQKLVKLLKSDTKTAYEKLLKQRGNALKCHANLFSIKTQ